MAKSAADKKKKSPRLGRGLSSLMATPVAVEPAPPSQPADAPPVEPAPAAASAVEPADAPLETHQTDNDEQAPSADGLIYAAIDAITPNHKQPRQHFEELALQQLAASIKADGLLQPIVLRPIDAGALGLPLSITHEIVAGERRWRAAQLAGLQAIPALVREMDEKQLAEWALIENVQREDLNPIEKATAIQSLIDSFKLSHQDVAERLGMDRTSITNLLRLLGLSDFVRELVAGGLLSMGQARALAGLSDFASQASLARRVVKEGMSVRAVEAAVRKLTTETAPASKPSKARQRSAYLVDVERQLREQLGTKVEIKEGRKKNAGSVTIHFYDNAQFEKITEGLGIKLES